MLKSEEIEKHKTISSAWVLFKEDVLDITGFLPIHPGGDELLLPYLGKDISLAFHDAEHSEKAEKMLGTMKIGKSQLLFPLINPLQGTLYQVYTKLDLEKYIKFINSPVNISRVRIFDNNILEFLSKTPWYEVLLLWIPVIFYYLLTSYLEIGLISILFFIFGVIHWTLLEYFLHRFAFHSDKSLPDNKIIICAHYLLHSIHHAYPMDNLRLMFPAMIDILIAVILKHYYFNVFFPIHLSDPIFAGQQLGYTWYCLFHYSAHHWKTSYMYQSYMKSYHLAHHYKNSLIGFGVSNDFWDIIFNTRLEITRNHPKIA